MTQVVLHGQEQENTLQARHISVTAPKVLTQASVMAMALLSTKLTPKAQEILSMSAASDEGEAGDAVNPGGDVVEKKEDARGLTHLHPSPKVLTQASVMAMMMPSTN